MIEKRALLSWTYELVAFANGDEHSDHYPFFTGAAPEEIAAIRKRAQGCCELLTELRPTKWRNWRDPKLLRATEKWLRDWQTRDNAQAAYPFVPMDIAISFSSDRRLELNVARFSSLNGKLAVTVAALVQAPLNKKDVRPLVRRCDAIAGCSKFCVREPKKGRPRLLCAEHSKQGEVGHRRQTKTFEQKPMRSKRQ